MLQLNSSMPSWPAADYAADIADAVHVIHPLFDYVPADLVNLFIFNMYGLLSARSASLCV